nr:piggyBac transposable element-derived protein 4-like [Leptinotarsa decemlineata]
MKCFSKYMSRDRSFLILRSLHFARNPSEEETTPEDRLYKIRPLLNYFHEKMKTIYYPNKNLSLDESMLLWRGRLVFRQYLKNKRHKYGIKLYMPTESDGLVMNLMVYTGQADEYGGLGHAEKVVLNLMNHYLNAGHALYMDNFYNSFGLAKKLLEVNTYCTGTLRAGRKETPKDVTTAKLKKGETKGAYKQNVLIGKWRDKRNVLYISTEFKNDIVPAQNRNGIIKEKPLPIAEYNKFMSGIDRMDQMMSYYPSVRKSLRWYKKTRDTYIPTTTF